MDFKSAKIGTDSKIDTDFKIGNWNVWLESLLLSPKGMGNWKSTLHACGWSTWHDMLDNFGISVYPPARNFLTFFQYSEDFLWFLYIRVAIHEPLTMNPYFSIPSRIHISVYPRSDFSIPSMDSYFSIPSMNSYFSIPSVRFQYTLDGFIFQYTLGEFIFQYTLDEFIFQYILGHTGISVYPRWIHNISVYSTWIGFQYALGEFRFRYTLAGLGVN